jgi:hypothetical protein
MERRGSLDFLAERQFSSSDGKYPARGYILLTIFKEETCPNYHCDVCCDNRGQTQL